MRPPGGSPTSYDEHPETPGNFPESRKCASNIDSLISHYSSFGEAIQANSAIGLVESEKAGDIEYSHLREKRPIPEYIPSPESNRIKQKLVIAAMPAYNEEQSIAKIIIHTKKYVDRVLVVDDGSTDSTAEIARALGAIVIRHSSNKGYGGALQTIFNTARELAADALIILDADGQHDPSFIPNLLKPIEKGCDVVIGSRFLSTEKNDIPAYRIVGMKVLDTATNIAGNIDVSDSQSGFRAYGRRAIEKIKVSGNGMAAGSEILLQIQDNGLNVAEVPIKVRYDIGKTSSQNAFSHGISVLNSIIGILSYRRPLITFGVPGFVLVVIGLVTGSWAFATYHLSNKLPFGPTIVSALFLMLGLLLVTSGLILNSLVQIVKREK